MYRRYQKNMRSIRDLILLLPCHEPQRKNCRINHRYNSEKPTNTSRQLQSGLTIVSRSSNQFTMAVQVSMAETLLILQIRKVFHNFIQQNNSCAMNFIRVELPAQHTTFSSKLVRSLACYTRQKMHLQRRYAPDPEFPTVSHTQLISSYLPSFITSA